jgi:hypothetical protein
MYSKLEHRAQQSRTVQAKGGVFLVSDKTWTVSTFAFLPGRQRRQQTTKLPRQDKTIEAWWGLIFSSSLFLLFPFFHHSSPTGSYSRGWVTRDSNRSWLTQLPWVIAGSHDHDHAAALPIYHFHHPRRPLECSEYLTTTCKEEKDATGDNSNSASTARVGYFSEV